MADFKFDVAFRTRGGQFRSPTSHEALTLFDEVNQRFVNLGNQPVIEYVVGTELPYASHWIEQGWRRHRGKLIYVYYRGATRSTVPPSRPVQPVPFLRAAQSVVDARVRVHDLSEILGDDAEFVGVRFRHFISGLADDAVAAMQDELDRSIYSQGDFGYNPKTRRRWERTKTLYDSIRKIEIS